MNFLGAIPTQVLDFAYGSGVIATSIAHTSPSLPHQSLHLLDADTLALTAAKTNLPDATHLLSDGFASLQSGQKYDLIVSNPPVHVGQMSDFGVLCGLVEGARERLTKKGAMFVVTQMYVPLGVMCEVWGWEGGVRVGVADARFVVWVLTRKSDGTWWGEGMALIGETNANNGDKSGKKSKPKSKSRADGEGDGDGRDENAKKSKKKRKSVEAI